MSGLRFLRTPGSKESAIHGGNLHRPMFPLESKATEAFVVKPRFGKRANRARDPAVATRCSP
jgi:hypothetical protein